MALVKFGGGIIQMSGSLAGNTYARNRYGNYARARTKPVNPNTALQQVVRSTVSNLADRWSQILTADQRTAWNLYADSVEMKNRLGETIHLSGFNHYIRSNSILTRLALPEVDDGPTVFELPAADPTFAITMSEATQEITATYDAGMDWANEDLSFLCMFQGKPMNPQRNFFAGPWRLWAGVLGVNGAPPASPKISPAVFPISESQRVWCYARILRADGRLSTPFRASTFCAA